MTNYSDRQLHEAEEAARAAADIANVLLGSENPHARARYARWLIKHLSDTADALGFDLVERDTATRAIHDTAAKFCGMDIKQHRY